MELHKHDLSASQWNGELCEHLCTKHTHEFDEWWDPEKYNWKDASEELARFCYEHFDKWWNEDKFNWIDESAVAELMKCCYMYFDKWWDETRFNNLIDGSYGLARYCYMHFHKWWNPETFNWDDAEAIRALGKYCYEYANIWFPDYVKIMELSKTLLHISDFEKLKLRCALED